MGSTLDRLARWYESQCNDDWEHQFGVKIDTLDNPGWSIKVDLRGTALADRMMNDIQIDRSERDWLRCKIVDNRFEGFGGPSNLSELVDAFLAWADATGTN